MKLVKITGILGLLACVLGVGYCIGVEHEIAEAAQAKGARVYEMRTYTTNDGKLDDLHARFANHTNTLFVRHNMTLVGYWTPVDKDNTLTYIIGHESEAAAKKNWQGFISDPDWVKAYADSKKDGPLVKNIENVFLTPTDYSPLR